MGRSEGIEPSTREPQSRMFPLHYILHRTRHNKYMALRNRRNSVNCCKCLGAPKRIRAFISALRKRYPCRWTIGAYGGTGEYRNPDLILTKDALFPLSYSTIWHIPKDSNSDQRFWRPMCYHYTRDTYGASTQNRTGI